MDRENLQNYWNQRFKVYGHTGWKSPLIYRYDQKIRVNAFKKLLFRKNISLIDKNVLDIGCGTGDFVYAISKLGANVTGCDISNKLFAKTSKRFSKCDNIEIYCCDVKDFNFADSISNASTADRDTLRAIVKTLPTRSCVVLGRAVNELPIVARVSPLGLTALGETRLFFSDRTKIPQLLLAVPKTNGSQTRLSIE